MVAILMPGPTSKRIILFGLPKIPGAFSCLRHSSLLIATIAKLHWSYLYLSSNDGIKFPHVCIFTYMYIELNHVFHVHTTQTKQNDRVWRNPQPCKWLFMPHTWNSERKGQGHQWISWTFLGQGNIFRFISILFLLSDNYFLNGKFWLILLQNILLNQECYFYGKLIKSWFMFS